MTPLKQQLLDAIATAPDSLIAQLLTYLQTLIQPALPTLRLSTRTHPRPPYHTHNRP
ncbi:MAG: hypothetical protein HC771_25695, partial [Synechococcales cyanobacterium CRU_2_2]|nr:hypothetical protein [Synechococcales cyanobacterium CRU_2_2]